MRRGLGVREHGVRRFARSHRVVDRLLPVARRSREPVVDRQCGEMELRCGASLERLCGPVMEDLATSEAQAVVDRPLDKRMAEPIAMAVLVKHPGPRELLEALQ
jgi:hypothetical protein